MQKMKISPPKIKYFSLYTIYKIQRKVNFEAKKNKEIIIIKVLRKS